MAILVSPWDKKIFTISWPKAVSLALHYVFCYWEVQPSCSHTTSSAGSIIFLCGPSPNLGKLLTPPLLSKQEALSPVCVALRLIHPMKSRRNAELQNPTCFFLLLSLPAVFSPVSKERKEILSINFGLYKDLGNTKPPKMFENCS